MYVVWRGNWAAYIFLQVLCFMYQHAFYTWNGAEETEAESLRQPAEWKPELRYGRSLGHGWHQGCQCLDFIFTWNTNEHFSFWSHYYLCCTLFLADGWNFQPIPDFYSEFAGEFWHVKYLLWKRCFTSYLFCMTFHEPGFNEAWSPMSINRTSSSKYIT